MHILGSVFLQVVAKGGFVDHQSGIFGFADEAGTWDGITRIADFSTAFVFHDDAVRLRTVDNVDGFKLCNAFFLQVQIEKLKCLFLVLEVVG